MAEAPPVILDEQGNIVDHPGYQPPVSERHPTDQNIRATAKVIAPNLPEKDQIKILKLSHEVGLAQRRELSIDAGKQGREWKYPSAQAPQPVKLSIGERIRKFFGG